MHSFKCLEPSVFWGTLAYSRRIRQLTQSFGLSNQLSELTQIHAAGNKTTWAEGNPRTLQMEWSTAQINPVIVTWFESPNMVIIGLWRPDFDMHVQGGRLCDLKQVFRCLNAVFQGSEWCFQWSAGCPLDYYKNCAVMSRMNSEHIDWRLMSWSTIVCKLSCTLTFMCWPFFLHRDGRHGRVLNFPLLVLLVGDDKLDHNNWPV